MLPWLVHEGFFHRFRVSINHRQVGAHGALWTPAPLLPFLERARTLRCLLLSPKGATYSSPGHRPISAKLSFAIQRSWKPTAQKKAGFCLYLSAYGAAAWVRDTQPVSIRKP